MFKKLSIINLSIATEQIIHHFIDFLISYRQQLKACVGFRPRTINLNCINQTRRFHHDLHSFSIYKCHGLSAGDAWIKSYGLPKLPKPVSAWTNGQLVDHKNLTRQMKKVHHWQAD